MRADLLYFDGCPHWRTAAARLQQVAAEVGATVEHHLVTDIDQGHARGFAGSPTILVDGRDPFPGEEATSGLSCRVYSTPEGPAGSPTLEQLRAAMASDSH